MDSLRLLEQNNGYSAPKVLMSPHVDFTHVYFRSTPELNLGCNNWFIKQLPRPAPGSYTTPLFAFSLLECISTSVSETSYTVYQPENKSCINIWF